MPTYGRALCVTFLTISATAPAKGWKVKRTTCRPRGQTSFSGHLAEKLPLVRPHLA